MTIPNECFPSYFTDAQLDAINDLINESDLSQAAEYVPLYDSKCYILLGMLTNNCREILFMYICKNNWILKGKKPDGTEEDFLFPLSITCEKPGIIC